MAQHEAPLDEMSESAAEVVQGGSWLWDANGCGLLQKGSGFESASLGSLRFGHESCSVEL